MADEREDKIVYVIQFVIPAEAGNYTKELDSRFHGKPWIPHPPIKDFEGRQVRNDKKGNPVARLQGISS